VLSETSLPGVCARPIAGAESQKESRSTLAMARAHNYINSRLSRSPESPDAGQSKRGCTAFRT
jgi:hypothetical protein